MMKVIIVIMMLLIENDIISLSFNDNVQGGQQQQQQLKMTLKEFCQKHIHFTVKVELHQQPILCPNLANTGLYDTQKYICERLSSNLSIRHYHHQQEYMISKLYWKDLFTKLIQHLSTREVMFIGDSITVNTFFHLKCLAEYADIDISQLKLEKRASPYPSQLKSSQYRFSDNPLIASAVESSHRERWYNHILRHHSIKYLIFNTGMWWNYPYIHDIITNSTITTNSQVLESFKIYFQSNSPLILHLNDLIHTHNITIFWRDIAPAGICNYINHTNPWPYHEIFLNMNKIAQEALHKIGVFFIPHIWEDSLPYWNLHPEKNHDYAHYCIFHNQSVHTLWSTNIIDAILEH